MARSEIHITRLHNGYLLSLMGEANIQQVESMYGIREVEKKNQIDLVFNDVEEMLGCIYRFFCPMAEAEVVEADKEVSPTSDMPPNWTEIGNIMRDKPGAMMFDVTDLVQKLIKKEK